MRTEVPVRRFPYVFVFMEYKKVSLRERLVKQRGPPITYSTVYYPLHLP